MAEIKELQTIIKSIAERRDNLTRQVADLRLVVIAFIRASAQSFKPVFQQCEFLLAPIIGLKVEALAECVKII